MLHFSVVIGCSNKAISFLSYFAPLIGQLTTKVKFQYMVFLWLMRAMLAICFSAHSPIDLTQSSALHIAMVLMIFFP